MARTNAAQGPLCRKRSSYIIRSFIGACPNLVDTAIAVYGEGEDLLAQKGSLAGDKVEEWRRTVVSKYAGGHANVNH